MPNARTLFLTACSSMRMHVTCACCLHLLSLSIGIDLAEHHPVTRCPLETVTVLAMCSFIKPEWIPAGISIHAEVPRRSKPSTPITTASKWCPQKLPTQGKELVYRSAAARLEAVLAI